MIKTNLLPPELQTKKRRVKGKGKAKTQAMAAAGLGGAPTPVFALVALLLVVGFVCGAGYGAMWVHGNIKAAEADRDSAQGTKKARQDTYDGLKDRYKERFAQWQVMQQKAAILSGLMPENRLLWTEKFNMLSNLIPKGVYVTGIEITEKKESIPTKASNKARKEWDDKKKVQDARKKKGPIPDDEKLEPKPKQKFKPKITQTLVINALAIWDEEFGSHREKYIEFQKNMQNYELKNAKGVTHKFKDGFALTENKVSLRIKPGVQEKKEVAEVDVWAFKLTMDTLPFMDEEK